VRPFLIAFPATLLTILLVALALPTGEVVKLETIDAKGRDHHSALWIVEIDGAPYLRSGSPDSGWLARVREHPGVALVRDDVRRAYRAEPVDDPAVRRAVNEAMARKYGVADALVRSAVDVERSVPVRLEAREGPDVRAPQ
jgi:hypothetical protein